MINRRAIMKLIAGGGVAAATVSPQQVKSAVPMITPTDSPPLESLSSVEACSPDYSYRVIEKLEQQRSYRSMNVKYIDHDLASKRSWSPAFKIHVQTQRAREHQELISTLHRDDALRRKIARAIGIEGVLDD